MRTVLSAGLSLIALLPQAAAALTYHAPLALKADPEAEMLAWARANGQVSKGVDIHWIDFTEDGAPDVLADFGPSNYSDFTYTLFRSECGHLVFQQAIDAYGVDVAHLQSNNGVLSFGTIVRAPGDYSCCWTDRRDWQVKLLDREVDPARDSLCGNSPRPLAVRREQMRPFLESAPRLRAPTDGAVFSIYPRDMLLLWEPLPGADSYILDIEMFDPGADAWVPEDVGTPVARSASYAFAFVGAQPGRWRVRGVDRLGNQSAFSEWRTFEHRR